MDGPQRDTEGQARGARERAEELFGAFLAEDPEGDRAAFERFVARHAGGRAELREALADLFAQWRSLASLRARLQSPPEPAWNPLAGFAGALRSGNGAAGSAQEPSRLAERLGERRRPIDRYRFLGEVGRGGMGAVLRVRDDDLVRELAMKVMLEPRGGSSGESDDTRSLGRFLEEARVTGQLDHPCIVPVHDVGLDAAGRVFFTMKLVRGRDLSAIFELALEQREGWSRERALAVMLRVCEAMAYAHSRGVVHRDLKPSNVMVGDFGAVYVMDWGLARVLAEREQVRSLRGARGRARSHEDSPLHTSDGDVVGTPAYMSPEQAQGRVAEVGPASDVYAVGAMLYHLLGGRLPFVESGDGRRDVLRRVRAGAPRPLASLARGLPPELVAITEKAMARDPGRRYGSMQELAGDLRAWLEGRVVRAYRTGALAELGKWIRRNRAVAATLAAGLSLALGGLGGAALLQSRARAAEHRAGERLAGFNAELERANAGLEEARLQALESERLANRRATEAERQRAAADRVTSFLVGLFEGNDPAAARGADPTAREMLERAVVSIERDRGLDPLVRGRLLQAIASATFGLGRPREALRLWEEVWQVREQNLGPAAEETLFAKAQVAVTLDELGDLERSARLLEEVEAVVGERFDPDGELALQVESARLAQRTDPPQTLLPELRAFLQRVERVGGREHPLFLKELNHLGSVLIRQGDMQGAEAALREALESARRVEGANHPTSLRALSNLAGLRHLLDDFLGARRLYEEYERLAVGVLGPEHPEVLGALGNLAMCLYRLDEQQEAERLQRRVLEAQERVLGADADDTLASYLNLSMLCFRSGRLDEAERYLMIGYEATLARHGPDHETTITCVWNLAHVAAARGRHEEAEALFLEALAGRRRLNGPEHPFTLDVLWTLVDFYRQRGRLAEAAPLAEELVRLTPPESVRYEGRVELRDQVRSGLSGGGER